MYMLNDIECFGTEDSEKYKNNETNKNYQIYVDENMRIVQSTIVVDNSVKIWNIYLW